MGSLLNNYESGTLRGEFYTNYFFLLLGSKFLCSVLVAPVKNEEGEIILFILNLEDITNAPLKSSVEHNAENVVKNGMSHYREAVDRMWRACRGSSLHMCSWFINSVAILFQ